MLGFSPIDRARCRGDQAFTILSICVATVIFVATSAAAQPATPPDPPVFKTEVIASTPLPGVDLTLEQIPAPVQSVTAADIAASGTLDLSDFLNRRIGGIQMNDIQGNPFQADVSYRGFTASPLLGTPQGLSVYMDGVRLNQPFGDIVSWDLIPRLAIASSTLMPGSNPVFGLNTLGGALALRTKDGRGYPGTVLHLTAAGRGRRVVEFEHGGANMRGFDWFTTGNWFTEEGWRDESPSDVRQIFGKIGWRGPTTDLRFGIAHADNRLTGNGLQEIRLLSRDYDSVYTTPDITENRSTLVTTAVTRQLSRGLNLAVNAYYRRMRATTLNGDVNEEALDMPAGEVPGGLLNRTRNGQHNGGVAGQITSATMGTNRRNQLTVGGGFDRSRVTFGQTSKFGSLTGTRAVIEMEGSDFEAEQPFDGPDDAEVDLGGDVRTWSAYVTDTATFDDSWHLTLSGRYNGTHVRNRDRLVPGGASGSLDGDHRFNRFNPSAGLTFSPSSALNVYASVSEGSRAPTSIELGCADADQPCKLPNAMAGDPPLAQVVTRSWEAGVRGGGWRTASWQLGLFRADNRDDILFVASTRTGFGYFANVDRTRRTGIEATVSGRIGRAAVGASYSHINATYQSDEIVNGAGNSTNDAATAGIRGVDGTIEIAPGDRIPLIAPHTLKLFGELPLMPRLLLDLDLRASSGSYARGNENNRHQPDGLFYLGPGSTSASTVLNAGLRFKMRHWLEITARVENLLDRRYDSAAQLGSTAFSPDGIFTPRPLPPVGGDWPLQYSTFVAPGAPRLLSVGSRLIF